jgi:UTP-glucose-1-phosphate uridylyltransferase
VILADDLMTERTAAPAMAQMTAAFQQGRSAGRAGSAAGAHQRYGIVKGEPAGDR